MEIVQKFKPFRLSPVTKQVEEYLISMDEGDLVTYNELSALIGMDCTPDGDGYRYVWSARERLRSRGYNFVNIRTEGYRKLNPDETIQDHQHEQKNLKRRVNRGLNKLEALDIGRLGKVEKLEYHAATIVGRMVGRVLSQKAKIRMIEAIREEPERIDYEQLANIYLRNKI